MLDGIYDELTYTFPDLSIDIVPKYYLEGTAAIVVGFKNEKDGGIWARTQRAICVISIHNDKILYVAEQFQGYTKNRKHFELDDFNGLETTIKKRVNRIRKEYDKYCDTWM